MIKKKLILKNNYKLKLTFCFVKHVTALKTDTNYPKQTHQAAAEGGGSRKEKMTKKNIIGTLKVIGATIAFILFMGVEWF